MVKIVLQISKSQHPLFLARSGKYPEVSGTWTLTSDVGVQLVIDNVTYEGVFSHQWDIGLGKHVLTFSAMSPTGVGIWGVQH